MKRLIILLLMIVALSGCRKYCFNCKDVHGTAAGQKCFHTEEEQNTWYELQKATDPNKPISCE